MRMQRKSKRNPEETLDSVGGSVRGVCGVSQLPFSKEKKTPHIKHKKCFSLIATQSPDNLLGLHIVAAAPLWIFGPSSSAVQGDVSSSAATRPLYPEST